MSTVEAVLVDGPWDGAIVNVKADGHGVPAKWPDMVALPPTWSVWEPIEKELVKELHCYQRAPEPISNGPGSVRWTYHYHPAT